MNKTNKSRGASIPPRASFLSDTSRVVGSVKQPIASAIAATLLVAAIPFLFGAWCCLVVTEWFDVKAHGGR